MISAEHLKRTFGRDDNALAALNGISLQIKQGESVAIVGKSGSGKSTLMHVLATLDSPTEGSVHIDGRDTRGLKRRELNSLRNHKIGFVFQQFFLNPREPTLENVALPLKIAGMRPSERQHRAEKLLKLVGMEEKARERAVNLSGGQKQRACIARALVTNPSIIFADEPTGNLDSETGATIMRMLASLHKKRGITLVIVTHDEDIAASCQRRIHIKDGRLVKGSA